jgi:S1-C subfamily serine protease
MVAGCLLCCVVTLTTVAVQGLDAEKVASELMANTVTIRITHHVDLPGQPVPIEGLPNREAEAGPPLEASEPADALFAENTQADENRGQGQRAESSLQTQEVTVCSGSLVSSELIVTFTNEKTPGKYRVTLPDGTQTEAQPQVTDRYSGLVLLKVKDTGLAGLKLSDSKPKVGATVMTASGAGIERPIVSRGIVGGLDRKLPGIDLPPLLQSDVRTTETSSGAPLVDLQGRLVGVIIATDAPGQQSPWSYAVGVSQLRRLLAIKAQGNVVLQRQRPSLGLTMRQGEQRGSVICERVTPGGPADQAGIRTGDYLLEAEGHKLRSVYQAVQLVMRKQPGDRVRFKIQQGDQTKLVEVSLSGTTTPGPGAQQSNSQVWIGPQLKLRKLPNNRIDIQNARNNYQQAPAQAAQDPTAQDAGRVHDHEHPETAQQEGEGQDGPPPSARELLKKIQDLEATLRQLRAELAQRDREHQDALERLHRQREPPPGAEQAPPTDREVPFETDTETDTESGNPESGNPESE